MSGEKNGTIGLSAGELIHAESIANEMRAHFSPTLYPAQWQWGEALRWWLGEHDSLKRMALSTYNALRDLETAAAEIRKIVQTIKECLGQTVAHWPTPPAEQSSKWR